jgi:uridine kinase
MEEFVDLTIMGDTKQFHKGITLEQLSRQYITAYKSPIVAAVVNNDLTELTQAIMEDATIEFLDLTSQDGMRIYQRSMFFLLICATKEVLGDCKVLVEHSIGRSYYCEIIKDGLILTAQTVADIEKKMQQLVEKAIPIEKMSIDIEDALEIFKANHMDDKIKVFKYKKASIINLYRLNNSYDYFYGYMVPNTAYLQKFSLTLKQPGVALNLPSSQEPDKVPEFKSLEKLTQIFQEFSSWGRILNVDNVGDLNDVICKGEIGDLIRVSEALQEKKIAQIADRINEKKDTVGVVLIAGPSSSGKTTFAQRLCVQLRVNGIKPYAISLDDYYVNREFTPKDEKGELDFEALEAIDIELFNRDLTHLLNGETVELPTFNFKTGKREYKGKFIKLNKNEILVIEGIHGLNEKLSASIPKANKFKIYLSALTQLNIDNHNRIPTTDARLIRRMVRDNHFRGFDAATTISLWPSVRRGEEKNIFPYQEEADIMFNSSLIYELAVLKQYVEPLLFQIDKTMPQYAEAKRLIKFMNYFLSVPSEDIPNNSIIREFIGGSCFKV